jgi:hypothetical protein
MLEKRRNVYPRQNQMPPLSGLVWGLELVDAKDWRRRCPAVISSESSVNVADNSFSACMAAADYFARVRRFHNVDRS